ncbi:hypothetical protein [Moorena bouillonii]|uniref:hypothetical protein n=1 Tax=Moorena bouillonii TaxID=207920 RepID=UPI00117C7D3A|nr:hypothetical protein [Moorena bouillonii]NEO46169.1 hypothetical protein [Moorena sp. SIO4A3]
MIRLPASFSSLVSSSVAANPLYPLDGNMVNVWDYGAKGDGIALRAMALARGKRQKFTCISASACINVLTLNK